MGRPIEPRTVLNAEDERFQARFRLATAAGMITDCGRVPRRKDDTTTQAHASQATAWATAPGCAAARHRPGELREAIAEIDQPPGHHESVAKETGPGHGHRTTASALANGRRGRPREDRAQKTGRPSRSTLPKAGTAASRRRARQCRGDRRRMPFQPARPMNPPSPSPTRCDQRIAASRTVAQEHRVHGIAAARIR